jgi:hypothetical protein
VEPSGAAAPLCRARAELARAHLVAAACHGRYPMRDLPMRKPGEFRLS